MQFKNIQGVKVPEIGMGTYRLHNRKCLQAVLDAIDIGYRHIDTAQMYQNEREVGEAIRISSVSREEFFVTTKIWHTNLAPDDVLQTTERSLRNLDTDYVDLLLIHWPHSGYDVQKTIEAMLLLRDQGKAINIGVSNFTLPMLQEVNDDLRAPIFCEQVEYHPFIDQLDILEYAIKNDILFTAYAPLAQGGVAENENLVDIAQNYNKTPAQVALRWLIEQENVAAIPKGSSREHLEENFDIFDFVLSDEDFERIDTFEKSGRLVNPGFAPAWD